MQVAFLERVRRMSSLWLHGILARKIHSTRCWLHSKRAIALRVIDFVNVTGTKIFCCSVHGANCNSTRIFCTRIGKLVERAGMTPAAPCASNSAGRRFASRACRTVYFWFALSNFLPVRSAVSNAEAHIPTQPSSPVQDARVSFSHEDQERTGGDFPPSRQGTQARRRKARLPRVIA